MTRRGASVLAVAAVVVLLLAACGDDASQGPATALDDDAITVASFDFAESDILAHLYAGAIERAGVDVELVDRAGPRELVQPALASGLVELVPEYAGTALEFLSLGDRHPSADVEATHAALADVAAGRGVVALTPAPAQDANAIAVTSLTAERYDLEAVSDLAPVAGGFVFGGPPECPVRPFCLQGLQDTYGLRFQSFIPLDAGGPLTMQALSRGDVDAALVFSTDPDVQLKGMRLLTDDRALQPAENVTPLVRAEVVDRWGHTLVDRLDEVSSHLTTDELRGLNAQVERGLDVAAVTGQWLDRAGVR